MTSLEHDIRIAFRIFRKTLPSSVATTLTLALALAGTTVLFSILHAVVLRPLPFPQADRLISIRGQTAATPEPSGLDVALVNLFSRSSGAISAIASYGASSQWVALPARDAELEVANVSSQFFELLAIPPTEGRFFEQTDHGSPTAVISQRLFEAEFGGQIPGQRLRIGETSYRVIGVASREIRIPGDSTDIWTLEELPEEVNPRFAFLAPVMARLASSSSREMAESELRALAVHAWTNAGMNVEQAMLQVESLEDALLGEIRPALILLFAGAMLLMLIGCLNVAAILLARAGERRREFVVRSALGASKYRLIRQLLVESGLTVSLAGGFGVLMAAWGVRLFISMSPVEIPRGSTAGIDSMTLLFVFSVLALSTLAFGLTPAVGGRWRKLAEHLRERGSSGGSDRNLLRRGVVGVQIALAMVLLVAGGLLIHSFLRLQSEDLGYDPSNVLVIDLPRPERDQLPNYIAGLEALDERIHSYGAFVSSAWARSVPFSSWSSSTPVSIGAVQQPDEAPRSGLMHVNRDFFEVLRIPFKAGATFPVALTDESPPLVIVNDSFARRFFPKGAVGERVFLAQNEYEIQGVVAETRSRTVSEPEGPMAYVSLRQNPRFLRLGVSYLVRSRDSSSGSLTVLKQIVDEIFSATAQVAAFRLDSKIRHSLATPRFYAAVASGFATVILVLIATGLYGLISFSVVTRSHEMAVRRALGASPGGVIRLLVMEGGRLILLGAVIGGLISIGTNRFISTQILYQIDQTDFSTYLAATAFLVVLGLLACYLPARRLARISSADVLRAD